MTVLSWFTRENIQEVIGVNVSISQAMYDAIRLWQDIMTGCAPWNNKAHSCGIPAQLSGRLAMLVQRELSLEVPNKAIEPVMLHLDKNIDTIIDYITLLGASVVRPIYANGTLSYEILPLGNYLPIAYSFDGTLTSALLLKDITIGKDKWLLTETHRYDEGARTHTVTCTLYRNIGGALHRVPLSDCVQTADITAEYTWTGVRFPLFVEIRNRAVNKIDGSNTPVPIIAGAEELIRDADEQYERINWEQRAGEARVWADRDLFMRRRKKDGTITGGNVTGDLHRLLVMVDGDGGADSKKIVEHAPALRTEAQNAAFQQILRRLELTCNVGKGTISDAESVQQTATQYTGGRQELYAIVDRIEDELETKLARVAAVFAHIAAAYQLGANDARIVVKWNDDMTRKDMASAKTQALSEIAAGVRNKWEYRRDFYGEDEATAQANTPPEPVPASPFSF